MLSAAQLDVCEAGASLEIMSKVQMRRGEGRRQEVVCLDMRLVGEDEDEEAEAEAGLQSKTPSSPPRIARSATIAGCGN